MQVKINKAKLKKSKGCACKKNPLAEVFHCSPATAPEKKLDAWLMTSPLGTPRGRFDEDSSKFSLS
jgi:hypothetical protein